MLLVTDYDTIQGIDRLIIVIFSIGMFTGAFLIGILILIKTRKIDIKSSKRFLVGVSLFALFFGLGRLILFYHDYFADNSLDIPLWLIGSGLTFLGLICMTFAIEKYIFQKTKMIASILSSICLILLFVLTIIGQVSIAKVFIYVGTGIAIIIPFFIYLYIAKISTGALRRQATIIILGMIVMLVASVGGDSLFKLGIITRVESQLFSIIVAFLGIVILCYGFVKTPSAR